MVETSGTSASGVDRPVFIVGPHRSGTTLVYGFLSKHADVGWISAADRRFPNSPLLAHVVSRLGYGNFPHEGQRIWDRHWTGQDDRMGPQQATPEATAWYREKVRRIVGLRGRTRFLAKYPRHSLRLGWLDAVFPGCLFLQVVRDWRAVVHSTVRRMGRREGDAGDDAYFGVRIPGWRETMAEPHPVVASRIYRYVTLHLEAEAATWGPRLRRVGYEALCARPGEELRGVCDWAGLRWTPEFEAAASRTLEPRNSSWKTGLDAAVLAKIRAEDPTFYGRYEVAGA